MNEKIEKNSDKTKEIKWHKFQVLWIYVNFFTFCRPKNQLEKYTPPYGTAWGDPILMEGTVYDAKNLKMNISVELAKFIISEFSASS